VRRRIVVTGLVQGVFFRDSAWRLARAHGVTGWVRNRPDGAVEAVFEGEPDAVERMIEFARRGPRGARVADIEVFDEPEEGCSDFQVG
jgi:acylphosphatase